MEGSEPLAESKIDEFLADNPELEQLSDMLSTFNVFRALKIEHAEIPHSNTLAWLLDPEESHGLDDVVLRRVLSSVLLGQGGNIGISAAQVELMDFADVEVRREWQNIDVLVIDHGNQLVLLVENKIHGGETIGQLMRYRERVHRDFPGFRLVPVFLTLEGQPSESEDASGYVAYSHRQLLAVIERIILQRRSQLAEPAAMFIEHYVQTLRRLTMQDEKLVSLCKKIYRRHQEAIELIRKYGVSTCFEEVVSTVLGQGGEYEILCLNPSTAWFIPQSWAALVPENGTAWRHLKRNVSIACWLAREARGIRLILEVSRMDDRQLRLSCVKALDEAGFQFLNKKKAFDLDATYSRFYRASQRITDFSDEEELADSVVKLLVRAGDQFEKAKVVFASVFGDGRSDRVGASVS